MAEDDVRDVIRVLSSSPMPVSAAGGALGRGSGLYAWWARRDVFPDLPGMTNPADPTVRILYAGRATSLRGRILRNDLRRSGSSVLRRTLAGLLMPTTGYRTTWKDGVVLVPEDEARLTSWMRANLRLTWAEDPYPYEIENELVWRLVPPLNVVGVEPEDLQPSVVAAKKAYEASASPGRNPA